MKSTKWAVRAVGAGALTFVLAAPTFAQSRDAVRGRNDSNRGRVEQSNRISSSRDNQRVTVQGKVSSFTPERDGYRVRLDRSSQSYWVPQSYFRNRGRNLGIGINISLGGVYRGNEVYVDAVTWPGDSGYGYNNGYDRGYVRGVVERVDRSGIVWIRDDASGRLVQTDMRGVDRRSRIDSRDLRRGDRVELTGDWQRGLFAVYQIDSVRTGRY